MRKIFKNMAWTMAATLVMAACSDSLDESSGNGNDLNTDGTGYVKIALNLPSTSGTSTRADSENDDFNDGLAAEYKVNNVILALFYGEKESNATCKWAVDLGALDFSEKLPADDNITTKSDFLVREVPKPGILAGGNPENVYALAIVNGSDYFGISSTDNKLTFNAKPTTGTAANFKGDYADLFEAINTVDVDLERIASTTTNGGNFMMTNAPISDKPSVISSSATGWNPNITTLVKLDIYDDEPSAEAATPNSIYVERVVAKVTVKVNDIDGTVDNEISVKGDTYKGATVKFDNWTLQNTNKKTYLVRNVIGSETDAAWKAWAGYFNTKATDGEYNRFVGRTVGPVRTYWGIDPNYNKVERGNLDANFDIIPFQSQSINWKVPANSSTQTDAEDVLYCGENTTEATAMLDNQLTSVLLKATFKPEGVSSDDQTFFTCNGVSTIYTVEEMTTSFENVLAIAGDGYKLADGESIEVKASLTEGTTITQEADLNNVFEIRSTTGTGYPKSLSENQYKEIWKKYKNIKCYKDGVTYYYATVIKHFGDVYTPKDETNPENYTEANHLGRYGVLRNNWYELQINSVSGPGEPEIPELPEEPADKEHRYINCEINILSWAKRSQGVDL